MSFEDNLYKRLKIYSELPAPIKYLTGSLYRRLPLQLRYGSYYSRTLKQLAREDNFSLEEIREHQLKKLRETIEYAVQNVPFYKQKYNGYNISLKEPEEIRNLPLLTKDEVRNNNNLLLSNEYSKNNLITISTGGSTGEPLLLFYEKGIVRTREFTYLNHQWGKVGYKYGDKIAVFRSALIRGRINSKLWEYEPVKNRWIYSTFDLTAGNIRKIINHLRKVKPDYLYVYPSALTIIANYMLQNDEPHISSVKGILSASENAYPSQVKLFEQVFNCPVCRQYGLGELSAFAGSCQHSSSYHCYNTYSYVELIDENGLPVTEPGKRGEIVGTTFDIFTMPLIRYRTGDYAIYEGNRCSLCNHKGLVFSEIEGRSQETIINKAGESLSLGTFIFGIHEEFWSKISSIQFVQEKVGELKILASSNSLTEEEISSYVYNLFEKRFRHNFNISVIPARTIQRTGAGKHKYLIQKLSA